MPRFPLEEKLGYAFRNPKLLEEALTHRSYRQDELNRPGAEARVSQITRDNEKFEFLGDAILGMLVSEELYKTLDDADEGRLSLLKSQFVSSTHLTACAAALDLGSELRLSKNEERNGGRVRPTILANALEAVLAAVYLDGGLDPARRIVNQYVLAGRHLSREAHEVSFTNFVGLLQEKAQAQGLALPRYRDVDFTGPEHARTFVVEVSFDEVKKRTGAGLSKKLAAQTAAKALLQELGWI